VLSNLAGMTNHGAEPPDAAGPLLFEALPLPVCLVDAQGLLVALNPQAEAWWRTPGTQLAGRPALEALGVAAADGGGPAWTRLASPGSRPRLACRITTPDGAIHAATVVYTPLRSGGLGALFVLEGALADMLSDLPEWALRDPVSGLGNRHLWEREAWTWMRRSGTIAFFDLDDLKEVNDLHGHVAGDRTLAAVGRALAQVAPEGALLVRYGGDEFVVVVPGDDERAVGAWAATAVETVAATAPSAHLPIVPRLSHGVASFAPGGLREAVQRADDRLYERRGVLLPAASGARLILTRQGRTALRRPGDDRQPVSATVDGTFSPEFDSYFRAMYARSAEQAAAFVAFADPPVGGAVVEVGAGSGRITLGGLAQRIGSGGQLLATDPSGNQLTAARRRAAELGLDWVRFLCAPAEELPLASHTVDLVLGSTFLHFTDPRRALREMGRLLRPGGQVAVSAPLAKPWSASMLRCLQPLAAELAARGLPLRQFLLTREEILAAVAAAGLEPEREVLGEPEEVTYPAAEMAVAAWRQVGLIPLLMRGTPEERYPALQAAFDERLRSEFDTQPELRTRQVRWLNLRLRRR